MDNPKKSAQEINPVDVTNIDAPDTFRSATGADGAGNLNKANHVQFPEVPAGEGSSIPRQNSDMASPGPGYAPSIGTDDGEDSEEYDWSAEEDLVDEAAKFESKIGVSRRDGWTLKRFSLPSFNKLQLTQSINSVLTFLVTSLIGSVVLAGLIVTPALIVHFHWYNANPTPSRLFIKDNVEAWLFWAAANLIISWFLAMVIDIIPVLIRFFLSISWGHVSEHVKTRIEIYDSVKNTAKPAFYAGTAYASWVIIFAGIYKLYNSSDPKSSRAGYTLRMENVVQFFFFLILVWCIQGMLSHFIGMPFYSQLFPLLMVTWQHFLFIERHIKSV